MEVRLHSKSKLHEVVGRRLENSLALPKYLINLSDVVDFKIALYRLPKGLACIASYVTIG